MGLKALPIFTSVMVALAASTVFCESSTASSEPLTCKTRNGVPTTVARSEDGREQPVFHWRSEWLGSRNPQQLCNEVTQKLNGNAGGQLYGFATQNLAGKPVVCLEKKAGTCSQVLFATEPTGNPDAPLSEINEVLNGILDDKFKPPEISTVRGYESARYQVSLWDFMGL